jgi:Ca-activated chloride channel family protein
MQSEDFVLRGKQVNRMEMEKAVLEEFIAKRVNDRLGLVAFAQRPYIASPLTLDHDFLRQNLARLEIATQEEDGTAIGSALAAALNRLRELKSKSKIVILMTDGQNNAGKVPPLTAAEVAEKLGVKVYAIGVGTRGWAPVPIFDRNGRKVRYGRAQVNIDEDTLKRIAARTGGEYFRADKTETLQAIYDEIDRMEKTEVDVKKYQYYRELFPWFVLPGVALLLLELILANTVWRTLP